MEQFRSGWRIAAVLGACVAGAIAGPGSAQAFVMTNTSNALPLLGVPYTIPGGTCFNTAGFCVASGTLFLTSLAGPGFVQGPSDEDITTNATDTIVLTDLFHVPKGTVTLSGTLEQKVVGRADPSAIGTWTVELESVSLSGMLAGVPITLTLNPADLALDIGTTSIVPDGQHFHVESFFDVFAEVSYGSLTAFPSGVTTAGVVPEPATLALLAGPLLVLSAARRRRQ
jgi:hypothetical protein